MQNPNISNASHLTNRSQANLLDARSLSPSVHMMHNFHDIYPADVPQQQFYHSMPHVSYSIKIFIGIFIPHLSNEKMC